MDTIHIVKITDRYDGPCHVLAVRRSPALALEAAQEQIAARTWQTYVDGEVEEAEESDGRVELRRWYTEDGNTWITITAHPVPA